MRSWATMLDAVGVLRSFEQIIHSVRTGASGFETVFGTAMFAFLAERPENAAAFDAAMAERTAAFAQGVARAYDFSEIRTVVDVGGGNGTLLVEPSARAPAGTAARDADRGRPADAVLDAAELADRCQVLSGDFFERVPAGADRYLLANVLHDWDDARSIHILRNCRRAMARTGRVLIVERLIPEDGSDPGWLWSSASLVPGGDLWWTPACDRRRADSGGAGDARHERKPGCLRGAAGGGAVGRALGPLRRVVA
jgi:hypothetical protein